MRMRAALLGAAAMAAAVPADAQTPSPGQTCEDGRCRVRLTPDQLLHAVEKAVADKQFDAAEPMLRALARAPGYTFQIRFLTGFIAAGRGQWGKAADQYKAILADDPSQTQVRIELARAFMQLGQYGAADKQFQVIERTRDLSPEFARTIRTVRTTIRANRPWQFDIAAGIAPDTNINNATAADTVTVMLGDTPIPLDLDRAARAQSGLGITARASGSVRLPVAAKVSAIADLDVSGTEYKGGAYDTYIGQAAAGAEYQLSAATRVSLQGVAAQRWFGGPAVSRQFGLRAGAQTTLDPRRRLGLQLDARHTDALFNDQFSGWQYAAYGTFEQALTATQVLSVGPYVRRDALSSDAFSSTEIGGTVGVGGELKWGINFGALLGAARTAFDAPMRFFSPDPRRDWQVFTRATLGNRKLRVLGLSPQLNWSVTRVDSNYRFYKTTRSRFELTLARYF
jgi:hypothetical protein